MFLKNKKCVNWSNNIVKTKNVQFVLKWKFFALV
jgi:hypothetical protein